MVVFLADRSNLQTKRLHDRIKQMLKSEFRNVRRRRAEPTEPGVYRVVGETDPQAFLGNEDHPATTARVEIGFRLRTDDTYERYWINWIESDRETLVGWHQDDTHEDLGPVHLQMNHGSEVTERKTAEFVDSHPLDVVARRVDALKDIVPSADFEEGRL